MHNKNKPFTSIRELVPASPRPFRCAGGDPCNKPEARGSDSRDGSASGAAAHTASGGAKAARSALARSLRCPCPIMRHRLAATGRDNRAC